jgi:uncharacterized protein
MTIREEAVVFRCGDAELVGVVHAPPAVGKDVGIVIVVGGPQYRVGSHRQFVLLARALAKSGYPCIRFDYRGMGDSDGPVRSFDAVDADIRAAADALIVTVPSIRSVVLWGLCDAASACLMYAGTDARVSGLALANPWVRTDSGLARSYLRNYYGQRLLQKSFWAKVFRGEFRPAKSLGELVGSVRDSMQADQTATTPPFLIRMLHGIQTFGGPILLLLSERDLTAGEFRELCADNPAWRAAVGRPNVTRLDLADADHTFSARASLERATALTLDWLSRQIAAEKPRESRAAVN